MRMNGDGFRRLRRRIMWFRAFVVFIRLYMWLAFAIAGIAALVMIVPLLLVELLCRLGHKDAVVPPV